MLKECGRCGKKRIFMKSDENNLCKDCAKIIALEQQREKDKIIEAIVGSISVGFAPSIVGQSTGDTVRTDYYVYHWRIKETGEVFYVGKGRARRAYEHHESAYDANKIKELYDTEVVIVEDGLTESEALQLETDEMERILNETDDI